MAEHKSPLLSRPGELRILAFGDSLTEGYCDFGMTFNPYVNTLKTKLSSQLSHLKITAYEDGRSGDCVLPSLRGNFISRLEKSIPILDSEPPKYDFVVVLGGTNDLAHKLNDPDGPTEIFGGLKNCYNHVIESGSSLICLTVPERRVDTQSSTFAQEARNSRLQLNTMIERYVEDQRMKAADQPRVFLMDLAAKVPFTQEKTEAVGVEKGAIWSMDGLHMTADGYNLVGEELASFVHNLITSSSA
jgi:lysophospholipase L1-like esterase